MAATAVAVERTDPLATVFSPAQVGLASLSTGIRGAFYPGKAEWDVQYSLPDLGYTAWAVQGGVRLNDFVDLPLRVGLGVAYHRVDLNLGEFSVTNSSGPTVIGTFNSFEYATGVTIGLGFEYLVKGGFGYTFRSISSHLSPIGIEEGGGGTGVADVAAKDFGGYLSFPIVDLIEALPHNSGKNHTGVRAFADLSLGFAINNIGDQVVYVDAAQPDPLPRTARAGLGAAAGVRYAGWELVGATWSREGEDLLVVRKDSQNWEWEYQSGFGDLKFGHNVIAGHSSDDVALHTGWQLQFGEFFTYREGAYRQSNWSYETNGLTFRLAGLLKGIALAAGSDAPSWLLFLRDHLDVQYHRAKSGDLYELSKFEGLSVVLNVMPL